MRDWVVLTMICPDITDEVDKVEIEFYASYDSLDDALILCNRMKKRLDHRPFVVHKNELPLFDLV